MQILHHETIIASRRILNIVWEILVENDNADNVQELMQEQVNKIFGLWSSNLKLPTIGPTYAFSKDFGSFANDFVTLGKALIELKSNMDS